VFVSDIGDAQKSGTDVDGTQFISQVFTVWLPTPVVVRATDAER